MEFPINNAQLFNLTYESCSLFSANIQDKKSNRKIFSLQIQKNENSRKLKKYAFV